MAGRLLTSDAHVNTATETGDTRTARGARARAREKAHGGELVLRDRRRFSHEEPPWAGDELPSEDGRLTPETLARLTRLEAAMGATLSLLRRCIVEHSTPTREELASEAAFVFGTSRESAMAELDEVAAMVGVSSIR